MEKHLFVEEKVIFSIYNNEKNINNIDTVLKEHKGIFFLIEKIEENLEQGYHQILRI